MKYDALCFNPPTITRSQEYTSFSVSCKYSDALIQYVNTTRRAAIHLGFNRFSCSEVMPASSLSVGIMVPGS
jgi:23S rRNA G2069 N7-methylase RlmK/C1962 C5-methylase RlmI